MHAFARATLSGEKFINRDGARRKDKNKKKKRKERRKKKRKTLVHECGRGSGVEEVEGLERRDGTTRRRRRESGTRTWNSRRALAATPAKGAARREERAARTGRPLRRGLSPLCRDGRRQRARCRSSPQASETGADLRRVANTRVIPSARGIVEGKTRPDQLPPGGLTTPRVQPDASGRLPRVHESGFGAKYLAYISSSTAVRLDVIIDVIMIVRYDQ